LECLSGLLYFLLALVFPASVKYCNESMITS
jgi:hypothetical protein